MLDRAIRLGYVDKVKERCDTKTYRQFLDILGTYNRGAIDKVRLFRSPALSYTPLFPCQSLCSSLHLGSHQTGQPVIQRRTRAPCQLP